MRLLFGVERDALGDETAVFRVSVQLARGRPQRFIELGSTQQAPFELALESAHRTSGNHRKHRLQELEAVGALAILFDEKPIGCTELVSELGRGVPRAPRLMILIAPAEHNEITTTAGQGDVRVLTGLLLKGSNVQHEFN